MKHLYLPISCKGESEILLSGRDFHYITHVLRCRQGTALKGIDAGGITYILEIKKIERDSVLLSVKSTGTGLEEAESPGNGMIPMYLFQAIPKGKVMDRVVRQATETGIMGIFPVISRYTVVDISSEKKSAHKTERWQRIAKEALQQSGGTFFPYIAEPLFLENAADQARGVKLFFHPDTGGATALHTCFAHPPAEISLFIGPEGGFSDSEYNLLKKKGFIPINLGKNILRVDTAALYAIASVKMIIYEKKYWR